MICNCYYSNLYFYDNFCPKSFECSDFVGPSVLSLTACLVVEAHRAVVSTVALIALFLLIAASSKTSIYDAANLIFTLTVRNRALYAQNSRPSVLCKKCLPAIPTPLELIFSTYWFAKAAKRLAQSFEYLLQKNIYQSVHVFRQSTQAHQLKCRKNFVSSGMTTRTMLKLLLEVCEMTRCSLM